MGNMKRKTGTIKPRITKLTVIRVVCNGIFDLVTDFPSQKDFDKIFMEWFDSPETNMWCAESLILYIKSKQPNRICLLEKDYNEAIKGKGVIPATKEEYQAENN